MIRLAALRETIQLYVKVETGARDEYGNPITQEAAPVTLRAAVQPLEATEDEQEAGYPRDLRMTRYKVLVGPSADVTGLDRVSWRGGSYEVMGEAQAFVLHGRVHHFEFTMREVHGG